MKTYMIALKKITVLIHLLLISYSSVCQTTQIKEDSVCLTAEDARIIFKDLQLFEICDSIRSNQALQINHFKNVLKNDQQQILLHTSRISKLDKELQKTTLKLKISKKLTFFGVPIAFGAGIITVLILR